MKVAIINSFFPPWRGGAETYTYNLVKGLTARGHEVTVLCANDPLPPGTRKEEAIIVRRHRLLGRLYGTPIMPSLLNDVFAIDTDIFHANFPSPYIAVIVAIASRLRGIPAVLTWHNDLPPVTAAARILVLIHDRLVLPLYLSKFSFIIATSETYIKISPILNAQWKRVVVIRNGVDMRRFNPEVSGKEIRDKFNLGESKVILFVGALTKWHTYKGLDDLLKATAIVEKQLEGVRLLVVGGGGYAEVYRVLTEKLGLSDRVIFAGDVSDIELPKYYACADLLVLPSKDRSEGFGLTMLEANATGKPVIGTVVGGIPSSIRDGYNGLLVPPCNPKALAEGIHRILSDEELQRRLGRNGRNFALKQDWSKVAEETEEIYKRALTRQ